MNFSVVSLFPEMFDVFCKEGVIGRALQKSIFSVDFWNPRDFTEDLHRRVDDRPFGGGPGMVMMAGPLCSAVNAAKGKTE